MTRHLVQLRDYTGGVTCTCTDCDLRQVIGDPAKPLPFDIYASLRRVALGAKQAHEYGADHVVGVRQDLYELIWWPTCEAGCYLPHEDTLYQAAEEAAAHWREHRR